jgi:hypothetical protein
LLRLKLFSLLLRFGEKRLKAFAGEPGVETDSERFS